MIAAAPMGDANASIPTPQPVHYRPMFGAFGRALEKCVTFVSARPSRCGISQARIAQAGRAVRATRALRKSDMIHNAAQPRIEVDSETYEVRADGELLTVSRQRACR
jgi:urease subunit alpha